MQKEELRALFDQQARCSTHVDTGPPTDVGSRACDELLRVWFGMMAKAGLPGEALDRMRAAYAQDVAILRPLQIS